MCAARIAPIDQSSLRESAYKALRDTFTRGEFAPGDVLSLRRLADQLGTSITPVREAVRRLVAEGALIVGRALADFDCRKRNGERGAVGEHMRGVGKQGKAAKPERANHFGDQECGGQAERDCEPLCTRPRAVTMPRCSVSGVSVAMSCAHVQALGLAV